MIALRKPTPKEVTSCLDLDDFRPQETRRSNELVTREFSEEQLRLRGRKAVVYEGYKENQAFFGIIDLRQKKYRDLGCRFHPNTDFPRNLLPIALADLEKLLPAYGAWKVGFNVPDSVDWTHVLSELGFMPTRKVERTLSLSGPFSIPAQPKLYTDFQIDEFLGDSERCVAQLLELNREFYSACSLDRDWLKRSGIVRNKDSTGALVLTVRDRAGDLVGFADAVLGDPNPVCVMQRNTYVRLGVQRLGVGSALKWSLIKNLAELGTYRFVLTHNETENRAMTRLSERFGFSDTYCYTKYSKRLK